MRWVVYRQRFTYTKQIMVVYWNHCSSPHFGLKRLCVYYNAQFISI